MRYATTVLDTTSVICNHSTIYTVVQCNTVHGQKRISYSVSWSENGDDKEWLNEEEAPQNQKKKHNRGSSTHIQSLPRVNCIIRPLLCEFRACPPAGTRKYYKSVKAAPCSCCMIQLMLHIFHLKTILWVLYFSYSTRGSALALVKAQPQVQYGKK